MNISQKIINEYLLRLLAVLVVGSLYFALDSLVTAIAGFDWLGSYRHFVTLIASMAFLQIIVWMAVAHFTRSRWQGIEADVTIAGLVGLVSSCLLSMSFLAITPVHIIGTEDVYGWLKIVGINVSLAMLTAYLYCMIKIKIDSRVRVIDDMDV